MMKNSPTQIFRKKRMAAVVSPSSSSSSLSPHSSRKAKMFSFSSLSSSRRQLSLNDDVESYVEYHTIETGPSLWKALSGRNWTQAIEAVDINPQNAAQHMQTLDDQELPLHFAIKSCAPNDLIQRILAAYPTACMAKERQTGRNVLHLAALYDTPIGIVKELLTSYPTALMEKDVHGRIPFHYFVYRSNLNAVQLLLSTDQAAGNVHDTHKCIMSTDNAGHTPLHVAAVYSLESFRLLSRLCPEALNIKTNEGETPYDVAQSHGQESFSSSSNRAPSMASISTLSTEAEAREEELYSEDGDMIMNESDKYIFSGRVPSRDKKSGGIVMYEY